MKKAITFREAVATDSDRIWQIILQAKEQMRLLNSQQWRDDYPTYEHIVQDIERRYGYVLCQENMVIAYGAVVFDGEPAYDAIEGKWLTENPYVVVHRLATADEMKRRGIASLFTQKVEELSRRNNVFSFRVDTNYDNFYMLKLLATAKFTYCGKVTYRDEARLAYEKIL